MHLAETTKEDSVIVLGAGGHGKSVASVLLAEGYSVLGILDDDANYWNTKIVGVPVLGAMDLLYQYPKNPVIVGVGFNKVRKRIVERFPQANFMTVKSSLAYINPTSTIALGCIIFPFAVVGADVKIGEHVIVSAHTTMGHDTIVENFAHLAPGVMIAGGCHIGNGAMLGLGSVVCPKVQLGEGSMLAAGAVAIKNIPAGKTAYGWPAKPKN